MRLIDSELLITYMHLMFHIYPRFCSVKTKFRWFIINKWQISNCINIQLIVAGKKSKLVSGSQNTSLLA